MDDATERELGRRMVEAWKLAAPFLEEERNRRIRESDPFDIIPSFNGILPAYFERNGYRTTTGMEIMQQIFRDHRS